MRNRVLNEGLKSHQHARKEATVGDIEKAILSFRDEGYQDITVKMLIDATGYSRPVFGKSHVVPILKKHGIGKYKIIAKLPDGEADRLKRLEKELVKALQANERMLRETSQKDELIKSLRGQLWETKEENERLNHEIYELSKLVNRLKRK